MKVFKRSLIALCGAILLSVTAVAAPVDTGSFSHGSIGNYFGENANVRYNIKFRKASLREVLQFLSTIADVNMIIPQGVDKVVTVSFRDITLGDAMNSIIKANELDYTVEGGVIRLGEGKLFKDSGEDLKTETLRLKYATARDMVVQLKTLLSERGSVFADERTNSIIVREVPANIDNVKRYLEQVDIRDAQVLIEAKIIEATRSFGRSLGIQWGANRAAGKVTFSGLSAVGAADNGNNLIFNTPASSPNSGAAIAIGRVVSGIDLDIQLSAAENKGDAYVLSDPSIVTSNGVAAKIRSGATLLINASGDINIGGEGGTSTSGGAGLQQIETGVELNVTPQISMNSFVKLQIETITSSPDFSRAIDGLPVIVDNTAQTTVMVKDGETTVIGGLTRFSDAVSESRVPGLSRIPVVGNLFKSKTRSKENTELMVFIKPTIVRTEGQLPVQVRVREIEQRRESMYVDEMLNYQKEAEKKEKRDEEKKSLSRKANKYVR